MRSPRQAVVVQQEEREEAQVPARAQVLERAQAAERVREHRLAPQREVQLGQGPTCARAAAP